MKKTFLYCSYFFISLSILSLLYVSILAWINPKEVMSLVQTSLTNNDAISSIRGVYGGAGLMVVVLLIYGTIKSIKTTLLFLGVFWFLYAISRLLTILVDGPLGDFGNNWMMIESIFGLISILLYSFQLKLQRD